MRPRLFHVLTLLAVAVSCCANPPASERIESLAGEVAALEAALLDARIENAQLLKRIADLESELSEPEPEPRTIFSDMADVDVDGDQVDGFLIWSNPRWEEDMLPLYQAARKGLH